MRRLTSVVFLLFGLAAGTAGGYWYARPPAGIPGPPAATSIAVAADDRKVLYYRDPTGVPYWSAVPKKDASGRDYLPVYDDEEPSFGPGGKLKTKAATAKAGARRVLYYRNPMGLPDTSPVPKKDWMGMDYIAVYESEEDDAGTVRVSIAKMQRTGVRSEPVEMRRLVRPIRAPGVAKPDERTLLTIALRADSFIERLYANETGRRVNKGDPLFRIYSPDMVKVQVDYRISTGAIGSREEKGALQRLLNLQLPQAVIDELRRTREPVISFDWPSPVSGVVTSKKAIEGMKVKAGAEMLRIADLSSIWVIADVNEQDIGQIRVGSKANVTFRAFPGEVFDGRVTFVLHELEMATRTAKVRVEIANPDYRIKHEMFADVEINAGDGEPERMAVPVSALIDSGTRQVVIVDRGEGRFEPRPVKVGLRGDGYVEIVEGIKIGENVVVAANFLIDAESNLKAALSSFTAEPSKSDPAAPSATGKLP